jgi:hypothetical protein
VEKEDKESNWSQTTSSESDGEIGVERIDKDSSTVSEMRDTGMTRHISRADSMALMTKNTKHESYKQVLGHLKGESSASISRATSKRSKSKTDKGPKPLPFNPLRYLAN